MSSYSTRSCCEPSRGMMFRSDQKELYSKRMRRSLQRMIWTRDKIAPVCASCCSWANLRSRVIYCTTNSSLFCDRWASASPLETTILRLMTSNKLQGNYTRRTRRMRRERFCKSLLGGQEDERPSARCTISRLSRYDKQDRDDYLEHQNLDCMMNKHPYPRCKTKSERRTHFWNRNEADSVDSPTRAQVRKGMG